MLFDKFKLEEIITWLTFDLMQRKENFVMILEMNEQHILSEREYEDWINVHESIEKHEIVLFRKQNEEYIIHYNQAVKDVLIPYDSMQLKYDDFLKRELIA